MYDALANEGELQPSKFDTDLCVRPFDAYFQLVIYSVHNVQTEQAMKNGKNSFRSPRQLLLLDRKASELMPHPEALSSFDHGWIISIFKQNKCVILAATGRLLDLPVLWRLCKLRDRLKLCNEVDL